MTTIEFFNLLAKFAKVHAVDRESVLFREGLDLPSVTFLEFILEIELLTKQDIDVDSLDASIVTAGELYDRLFPGSV